MNLVEMGDTITKLDEIISQIPKSKTCKYSEVPNGRLWCNHYNQTMAGRCPSCPYYKLRGDTE